MAENEEKYSKSEKFDKIFIINQAKAVSDSFDSVVSLVNSLRLDLIFNSPQNIANKLEDFLACDWEPLSSQILTFQSKWNLIIDQISNYSELIESKSMDTGSKTNSLNKISESLSEMDLIGEYLPPPCDEDIDAINASDLSCTDGDSSLIDQEEVLNILDSINYDFEKEIESPLPFKSTVPSSPVADSKIASMLFEKLLNGEKLYQQVLFCVNMFFESTMNFAKSNNNQQTMQDAVKLFGQIPELFKFHSQWLEILENSQNSDDILKTLESFLTALCTKLYCYKTHDFNYSLSIDILHKFWTLKEISDSIPKIIDANEIRMPFEDALVKPTSRMMEYFTLSNELLKHVPTSNPFYALFQIANEKIRIFFEVIKTKPGSKKPLKQPISQWITCIEFTKGSRKHRAIFLFPHCLVAMCDNAKGTTSCMWHCALSQLEIIENPLDPRLENHGFYPSPKIVIDGLKESINKLREELASVDVKKYPKKFDKIKKELDSKTGELVLNCPSHPLFLYFLSGKFVILLFMNDEVLQTWKRLIRLRQESDLIENRPVYMGEINGVMDTINKELLLSLKGDKKNSTIDSEFYDLGEYDFGSKFSGKLFIKVLTDLSPDFHHEIVYNFEVDKEVKGYKPNIKNSKLGVTQSEIICLELENSAGSLFVAAIPTRTRKAKDELGAFVLDLKTERVRDKSFVRVKKVRKFGSVLIFLEFSTTNSESVYINQFNPLNPSVSKIVECEDGELPTIISYSIKFIEKHGIDERGIYRISGTLSRINRLRKLWQDGFIIEEKDLEEAEADVHVVAVNFKQFLRQLTEPLITPLVLNKLKEFDYQSGSFGDFEYILRELPPTNKKVVTAILDHLILVEKNEAKNKMTFQNLSTVFGVNILKTSAAGSNDLNFNLSTQITIFTHILQFWSRK